MDFFSQFCGGLTVILVAALIFGETVSSSMFMRQPAFQRAAVLVAMLGGILGGVAALVMGLGFFGAAAAGLFGRGGVLVQALSIALPLVIIAGAVIVKVNVTLGGLLLAAGSFGLLFTFGFNQFVAVPLALSAIAASIALVMVNDGLEPPEMRA
jgi:hypothetical protein